MKFYITVFISIIIGLFLELIALSSYIEPFRPQFLLMIVIFWSLYSEKKFGVFSAWLIGLIYDLSLNFPLGTNAIIFGCTTFLIKRQYKWLVSLTVIEQSLILSGFYFLKIIMAFLITRMTIINVIPFDPLSLLSIITSDIFWPILSFIMVDICYRLRIVNK